jgi:hypothetical protein
MNKVLAIVIVLFGVLCAGAQTLSHEDSVRIHGQKILDDKAQPTDDDLTFACLSNILSEDIATRAFYFKVYRVIAKKADGALAEGITGFTKTYFELYPAEAVDYFKQFDKDEQERFIDNIAYEFYASGDDFKDDVEDYFSNIAKHCGTCTTDNPSIAYIKKRLIEKAKKMAEGE